MADIGHGISLSFSTFTAVIQGTVDGFGLSADSIETSHAGLAAAERTFMQGWLDSGEVTFELQFNPDEPDPRDLGSATLTLTWPLPAGQSTPATWAATAFCTNYAPSAPIDGLMTASVTFKLSGATTFTASA